MEGCLSVPGRYGMVKRPEFVRLRAQDRDGNWFEAEGEGLTDGLLILSTADSAAPGQRITPVTDSGEETSSSGELMDMMMGAAQ